MNIVRFLWHRAPAILAFTVIAFVVIASVSWAIAVAKEFRISRWDAEDVFLYTSLDYVETTDDSIVMRSGVVRYKDTDSTVWVDQLVCEGRIFSSQVNSALFVEKTALNNTTDWDYVAPWPSRPTECFIRSKISITIGDSTFLQEIDSTPFVP